MSLHRPYVLTVGATMPRKNLAALSLAAQRLKAEGIEIVVVGRGGAPFVNEKVPQAMRWIPGADDRDLAALYRGALAVAMPSFYEGFGLPCLEALACGVPLVISDRGALPELWGSASEVVPAQEPLQWAEALASLVADSPRAQELRQRGIALSSGYGWDRTIRELDRLLMGIVGTKRQLPEFGRRSSIST